MDYSDLTDESNLGARISFVRRKISSIAVPLPMPEAIMKSEAKEDWVKTRTISLDKIFRDLELEKRDLLSRIYALESAIRVFKSVK